MNILIHMMTIELPVLGVCCNGVAGWCWISYPLIFVLCLWRQIAISLRDTSDNGGLHLQYFCQIIRLGFSTQ